MANLSLPEIIFGDNIKKLREKNNMSQTDLANQIGQHKQNIGNWEGGKSLPSVRKLVEVAYFFNVNVHDLLFNPSVEGESPSMRLNKVEHELSEVKNALLNLASFEKSIKGNSKSKITKGNSNTLKQS